MGGDRRPIWLREEDFALTYAEFHRRARALHDAAPANPAEAIADGVRAVYTHPAVRDPARFMAEAILAGLGYEATP